MTEAISILDLTKRFGERTALDGISVDVPAGSILGLLGPNGAGKTTLINCLTTLLRADAGTITVLGYDVEAAPQQVRASIAVTGQFAALDDQVSPHANLVFFGRLLGLDKRRAQSRAKELLAIFELDEAAYAPVGYLSGGMRRRLDLALSLVVPRPVLVLDEPTTGLDPRSRKLLWELVRSEASRGVAVLLTTQYLEEADQLADRIVVINQGRIIAEGSSDELKREVGSSICRLSLGSSEEAAAALCVLGHLSGAVAEGNRITLRTGRAADVTTVTRALDQAGIAIADIEVTKPTLDEVFFALTDPLKQEVS